MRQNKRNQEHVRVWKVESEMFVQVDDTIGEQRDEAKSETLQNFTSDVACVR